MKVELSASTVIGLAGVAVAGLLVHRVYRAASEALEGPAQALEGVADAFGVAYDWTVTPQTAAYWDNPRNNLAGLPPPADVSDSPEVARWVIDRHGYLTAMKWFTASALVRAAWKDAGTGTPPPRGSAMAAALGR